MNNRIMVKELPGYIVYYKEGKIKDYSEVGSFVVQSGEECLQANPDMVCLKPDYCYVNYLDGEYKSENIKIRYAQAVTKKGKETENIKFMEIPPVMAVTINHKGAYHQIKEAYGELMKYIKDNNYEIIDAIREHYIDGCWNKDDEKDYLTELQAPVRKK